MIEVVYFGEAGVHRAFDAEGAEHALRRGVPTSVPEELAERLCEREHFTLAAEDVESEPTGDPPETDEHELPDPDGVNADDPYVEE